MTDTLIADADGVYDLRDFNDQLLLGFKGTMSAVELHILAQRMQEARKPRHAAESSACRCRSAWPTTSMARSSWT